MKIKAAGRLLGAMGILAFSPALVADDGSLDQHWLLRGVEDVLREPAGTDPVFSPSGRYLTALPLSAHAWDDVGLADLRYYGAWDALGKLRVEWNLLATGEGSTALIPPSQEPLGRSPLFERQPYNANGLQVETVVDQLNLRWQGEALIVVAGRQPVNFGQNFYFSPLDLFQPFQPQNTYRDFRPGVDALRATWSTGHFTQFDAVAVAGYRPMPEGGNATALDADLDGPQGQGSLLARGQTGGDAWAVTALGGRFTDKAVAGASIQLEGLGSSWILESLLGDFLDSYDLVPLSQRGNSSLSVQSGITLGWTRQWNQWVDTRVELNQSTSSSWTLDGPTVGGFMFGGYELLEGSTQFQGAASASIQATPLLTLSPAVLCFDSVSQYLALVDAALSTSENGTLHLILEAPVIFSANNGSLHGPSQTQSLPSALSIDYRLEL